MSESAIEENNSSLLPPESIDNEEYLIRTFYHPDHIDEQGNIKPSAISIDDLNPLKDRGISVDRKKYVTRQHIEQNIENSVARKEGKSLSGFGLIKHENILNIKDTNNENALHVKSNPIPQNPAHALVFANNNYLPAELRKLRKAIIDELTFIKTIEEALE